jgi:hypothetical protein
MEHSSSVHEYWAEESLKQPDICEELRQFNMTEQEKISYITCIADVLYERYQLAGAGLVVQSERLTTDPDYYAFVFFWLTGLKPDSNYISEVFKGNKLNNLPIYHSRNAANTLENMPFWMWEITKTLFEEAEIQSYFEPYGYDVMWGF